MPHGVAGLPRRCRTLLLCWLWLLVAEITHQRDAAQTPLALSVAGRADTGAFDTAPDQGLQGLTTLLWATPVRVRLAQQLWRDPLGDEQRL